MIKISPSILTANFSDLGNEITKISKADYIHLDVMDGKFVPNLTFGAKLIKDLRKYTTQTFDTHLMVLNPDNYIQPMADVGVDIFTFHYEACVHHDRTIKEIKKAGMKAGISLNPSTDENNLKYLLDDLDLILVMTVNPGFGGQKFIATQLKKIENIKNMLEKANKNIEIEVDGGIKDVNIKDVVKAGANVVVSGSFIFDGSGNYNHNIEKLKNIANE